MPSYAVEQWLLLFYFYCFCGWLWESCYVSARQHQWVNRGFLHGPLLPIYGTGAISILFVTLPVRDNIPLIFLLGMLAATLLEWITGIIMEWLFHVRHLPCVRVVRAFAAGMPRSPRKTGVCRQGAR